MALPRSFAELYSWLVSVLPDALKSAGISTGAGGVSGSGTTGSIPKWSGSTALADSGASIDGNNRLAVPVGIAFPGGTTLDAAPAAGLTGSGVSGRLPIWSGTSALTSTANLTADATTGNVTSTGTVAAKIFQVSAGTGSGISDSGGNNRISIGSGVVSIYTSSNLSSAGAHQFQASGSLADGNPIADLQRGGTSQFKVLGSGKVVVTATDSSASPGAATINKPSGKSAIAAAAASVVITNSLVSASSIVIVTPLDLDATLTSFKAVPGAGFFTVTGNAAATAAWKFSWWVLN